MEFLLQNGWYILLLGFMGFIMFKGGGCCGGHSGHNNQNHHNHQNHGHSGHNGNDMQNSNQIQMEVDPVCGMYVNPETSIKQNVNRITYYFCSESCRRSFLESQNA